jgi:hypothetical protein
MLAELRIPFLEPRTVAALAIVLGCGVCGAVLASQLSGSAHNSRSAMGAVGFFAGSALAVVGLGLYVAFFR